ncbi:uncharacterized protein LAESUDRAFT_640847, partial [Laetiporus sulphureus 93-53]
FRIDVQLAGSCTVLLNQWEREARVKIDPKDHSYGHNLEKHCTTIPKGWEGSTGHHRIVQYIIVSVEVDAYIDPLSTNSSHGPDNVKVVSRKVVKKALRMIVVSDKPSIAFNVIQEGRHIAQSHLIKIKSSVGLLGWYQNKAYPQLFLSQTAFIFFMRHQDGMFVEIVKERLGNLKMQMIESTMQAGLARLKYLLRYIQELVIMHGKEGRLTLVQANGRLEVFQRTSKASCLLKEMLLQFDA